MNPLKVAFYRKKNKVFYKVLHQFDNFIERGCGLCLAMDGIKIRSDGYPDIVRIAGYPKGIKLFIRGIRRDMDDNKVVYSFEDEDEAILFINKATEAVRKLNESPWKAF